MGIASSCAKAGPVKYLQMPSSGLPQAVYKENSCGGNSPQPQSPYCLGEPGDPVGLVFVTGVTHSQYPVSRKAWGCVCVRVCLVKGICDNHHRETFGIFL